MIEVQNLRFTYRENQEQREVLRGVELTIHDGEWLTLLGKNGSGKTTLALCLNGLLQPTGGRVLVDGFDTAEENDVFEVRSRVAYDFQNPDHQIIGATVEEDVAFGPENLGLPSAEIRERVDRCLAAVGLTDYRFQPPHLLSGGQKQKVAVAGGLAMWPRYLILDEATSMLDPQSRAALHEAVVRLHREQGIAVIHISHFPEEMLWGDRVVVLDQGHVVLDAPVRTALADTEHWHALGLELPEIPALAHRLRAAGVPLPSSVFSVDELAQALAQEPLHKPAPLPDPTPDAPAPLSGDSALALDVSHLFLEYQSGSPFARVALDDVCLQVRQGEMIGLAGSSGSGKSTLGQCCNGVLRGQRGEVRVDGIATNTKKLAPSTLVRHIGLVFQYPEHQLFADTVQEELAFGCNNLGYSAQQVEKLTRESLHAVGLDESYLPRSPFNLSGGEKRRVALASILAMDAPTLVLDEPTVGLDGEGRARIGAMIRALNRNEGKTVLWIGHDLREMAALCDRLIVMDHGRIVLDGPVSEVFAAGDALNKHGLSLPDSFALAARLQRWLPPHPPRSEDSIYVDLCHLKGVEP